MTGKEWERAFGPFELIWTKFERENDIECRPGRHSGGTGYWEAEEPWGPEDSGVIVTTEVGPLGITDPESDARRSAEIENALDGIWVVILYDPDYADWSPWPVLADSREMAVARARRDWRAWCHSPDQAEVVKVYQRSWCGGIV